MNYCVNHRTVAATRTCTGCRQGICADCFHAHALQEENRRFGFCSDACRKQFEARRADNRRRNRATAVRTILIAIPLYPSLYLLFTAIAPHVTGLATEYFPALYWNIVFFSSLPFLSRIGRFNSGASPGAFQYFQWKHNVDSEQMLHETHIDDRLTRNLETAIGERRRFYRSPSPRNRYAARPEFEPLAWVDATREAEVVRERIAAETVTCLVIQDYPLEELSEDLIRYQNDIFRERPGITPVQAWTARYNAADRILVLDGIIPVITILGLADAIETGQVVAWAHLPRGKGHHLLYPDTDKETWFAVDPRSGCWRIRREDGHMEAVEPLQVAYRPVAIDRIDLEHLETALVLFSRSIRA